MQKDNNINLLIYLSMLATFFGVMVLVNTCAYRSAYNSPGAAAVDKVIQRTPMPVKVAPVELPENISVVVLAPKKETVQPCDPRKDWPNCGAVLYRNGKAERP